MLINIDEVATGALVNAIAVAGRRLSVAVGSMPRRRREHDLTVARWFGTYELTRRPPGLPEDLAGVLRGPEVQAALHELLAARLTDAPEADAARAHGVLTLTLGQAPEMAALADYYDDEICTLVARLEADDPPLLAQIRNDAFNTRIVAVLNAIERHTAALSSRPTPRTEAGFLASYRRHIIEQHGKLEPPDFDRRRRVPIKDIYVPTAIARSHFSERAVASRSAPEPLDVWRLAAELDRSVLLGDPGSGKTTAANVLMHHFASEKPGEVPFLVTLRDYAAKEPPERSVVSYIERTLETFYQSPPPPGLIELLLLNGRGVVIFDGLDELLDSSRRADITTRVERFCTEYPLASVLVTSRVIGYEQARLDPAQFTVYQLGGFSHKDVADYARKWFAHDTQARPGDASAFLAESASIPDLCSNPLMLALLCILYHGEGSLPRKRAEVYEQCAALLFRKWDARRRIHQDLRAGHLVEPALRHLAWWLFTRHDAQAGVSERDLAAETTAFLHGRGFESLDDARAAAREFVEFCRGRMWVFTDVGTTATGEELYAFTHRTFLEYFAAAELAYGSDTPEQLAGVLAPHIIHDRWYVVGELAVQIKDRTSNDGAQRIYAVLTDAADRTSPERASTLKLLAICLRSVDPSPQRVRELACRIAREAILAESAASAGESALPADPPVPLGTWNDTLRQLLTNCGSYRDVIADEIVIKVAEAIRSDDRSDVRSGLLFALSLSDADFPNRHNPAVGFWESLTHDILRANSDPLRTAAESDLRLRRAAMQLRLITTRELMAMPGGLSALFQGFPDIMSDRRWISYFGGALHAFAVGTQPYTSVEVDEVFTAIGEFLLDRSWSPPDRSRLGLLLHVTIEAFERPHPAQDPDAAPVQISQKAFLGFAALIFIATELSLNLLRMKPGYKRLRELSPYVACRRGQRGFAGGLPDLPVPEEFRQVFRDWAEHRLDLTASE